MSKQNTYTCDLCNAESGFLPTGWIRVEVTRERPGGKPARVELHACDGHSDALIADELLRVGMARLH